MSAQVLLDELRAIRERAEDLHQPVEDALRGFVEDHAGKGIDPYGNPWPATAEGAAPLQHARDAVRYVSGKGRVVAIVGGHNALHNLGRANGAPQRMIIPEAMTDELERDIANRVFAALKGNGRG